MRIMPIHPRLPFLLIFDLDGTLYCTESSFLATMKRVYREYGVPAPEDREILSHVGEPFPAFVAWLVGQGFAAEQDQLAARISAIEQAEIQRHGKLFPGVDTTLRRLDDEGHAIALCTNGDAAYARLVLGSGGILPLFACLKTLDGEGHSKTSMVAELVAAFPRHRPVVVGDRIHDIDAGRRNGCTVVAATYGYGNSEEWAQADVRIDDIRRLPDMLRTLG